MITPNHEYFQWQWHLKVLDAENAWQILRDESVGGQGSPTDLTFGGANVHIAVVDSGLDTNAGSSQHPALNGIVSDGGNKGSSFYDFSMDDGAGNYTTNNNDQTGGNHGVQCGGILLAESIWDGPNMRYDGEGVVGVAGNTPVIGVIAPVNGDGWLVMSDWFSELFNGSIPAANTLANVLPGNETVQVVSMSLSIGRPQGADERLGLRQFFDRIFFDAAVFGRKGKGIVWCVAAGNNGSGISPNQVFSTSPYNIIVGSTAMPNEVEAPFHFSHEVKANYSNYGEELDLVAPVGDSTSSNNARKIFTTTGSGNGTFSNNATFQVTLENPHKPFLSSNLRFDVAAPGAQALFEGLYISVGDPNPAAMDPFEVRRILKVDIPNNRIWIEKFKDRDPFAVAAFTVDADVYTRFATVGGNHNPTTLNVDSVEGFREHQNVFVGVRGGNGAYREISNVDEGNLRLEFTTVTPVGVGAGDPVYFDELIATTTEVLNNAKTQYQTVEVNSVEGFYPGQRILLDFKTPGGTGGDTSHSDWPSEISKVDTVDNKLTFLAPGGSWTSINLGMTFRGSGYGDFDSDFSGTSAATPMVAGAAGLLLSVKPELNWLEVKHILKETTDKVGLRKGSGKEVWRTKDGDRIRNIWGFVVEVGGKTLGNNPAAGATQIQVSPDDSMIPIGAVLQLKGDEKEYAIVKDKPGGNILELENPLLHDFDLGDDVKVGRIPHHSESFGYGRINLKKAVQGAVDYDLTWRDLYIRDTILDNGAAATAAADVDSPDIWVRNIAPDVDLGNAIPPNDANPTHQNPNKDQDKWIYVRVRNRGTTENSLEGMQIRLQVTFTADPVAPIQFQYPLFWVETLFPNPAGQDYKSLNLSPQAGFTYEEYFNWEDEDSVQRHRTMFQEYYGADPAWYQRNLLLENNTLNLGVPDLPEDWWQNPQNIPPIPPGGEYIAVFPWPREVIEPDPAKDRVIIKAQITPFDGLSGEEVHENNNLTFKEVAFTEINIRDGAGNTHGNDIPVSGTGLVSNPNFSVEFKNIDPGAVARCQVEFTMDPAGGGAPQNVTFENPGGGWAFTGGALPWVNLNAPVLSGPAAPPAAFQEATTFNGDFTLDNTNATITVVARTFDGGGNIIIEKEIVIQIDPRLAMNDNGIGREQTYQLYAFTEWNLLPNQGTTNNFGPISNTEFRTAAMFNGINSGSRLKAVASADGFAFLQEVNGEPNLLNLILKPEKQPFNGYGQVKYFVYRGIKKSSFLNTTTNEVLPQGSSTNDLLDRMWVVRNNLDAEELLLNGAFVSPGLKRSDFGLTELGSPIFPDTTPIEEIFDTNIFQRVQKGWNIGDFEISPSKEYGFEVIMESSGPVPVLGDVRELDQIITISYTAGQPEFGSGQEEDIKTKWEREQALNYLDPAAYFGQMANQKLTLLDSGGGTSEVNDINDFESQVLVKFDTRDKVYIDIRNELNLSLNFLGNYGDGTALNPAQVTFLNASSTTVNLPYHTNGWPILIVSKTDFPNNTTDDKLLVQLQLPNGTNTDPVLYLDGASFHGNFPGDQLKFSLLTPGTTHTNTFDLGILNNKTPGNVVPGALRMQYGRRYDLNSLPTASFPATEFIKDDMLDTLLSPKGAFVAGVSGVTSWNTKRELRYSGWSSYSGVDNTLQTGLAVDNIGEVAFAFVNGPAEVGGSTGEGFVHASLDLAKGKYKDATFFEALIRKKLAVIEMTEITLGSSKTIPRVFSTADNLSIEITSQSADDMITLAYTNTEKGTISTATSSFFDGPQYYVLINHELNEDLNGFPYFVADLGVQGIDYNGTTFAHEINQATTGLKVYSFDGRHYFTEAYATALTPLIPAINIDYV